jgi:hypothetical protein
MVAIVGALAVARGKHKTDPASAELLNPRSEEAPASRSAKEVTT